MKGHVSRRGSTPILGSTRDVGPEWVSFRGQKSVNGCTFVPKNMRMGQDFNTLNLLTDHHFRNSTWQWVVFL